ncbi:MAG: phosphatase PAP2 family protein [Pirellulaceae bacterium]
MLRSVGWPTLLVAGGAFLLPFDGVFANWLNADRIDGDLRRFFELTEFFAHGVGITFILLATWVLAREQRHRLPRVIFGILTSSLIVHTIKISVMRIRPGRFYEIPDSFSTTWISLCSWADASTSYVINSEHFSQSFPSGHSAAVSALAVGLIWLLGRGRILFASMAVLGCLQRILFHAHWPSDVLIGAAIGVATMTWFTRSRMANSMFRKWETNRLSSITKDIPIQDRNAA